MPWKSSDNLPGAAQKLKGHSRAIFVAAANAALKSYDGDEGRAIATAFSAVNKYKEKRVKKATEDDIIKATTADVEKLGNGKLRYRGIEFDGYNKPKDSNREGKQKMVLAKKGSEVKIVHFGDPSMRDNYSVEANDAFYARFGNRPEIKDPFSPLYWSAKVLWPRGSMKGKGIKKSLLDGFAELLNKAFGDVQPEADGEVEVTKAVDVEQRRAMFVVLEPDVVDAHGDTYSADEVEKACISFNTHCNKANLFHRVQTEAFKIEQSFIVPSTFTTDDGREIKKGTWAIWTHFPEDDANSELLWKMVKDGEVQGVSIGATAKIEELEDD
jgi:cation transport regulator ChaB